jgi:putative heme transporter
MSLRRAWPVLKYVLGLGLLAISLWVLSSHTSELSGLSHVFDTLDWWWVPPALLAEFGSFVCFAGMQYAILKSGDLAAPKWALLKMAFSSQALLNSLPGGSAASAIYSFRWFRRFGADTTLAAWSMAGTVIASIVSLSLVATAGLALAAEKGASLDLIPVMLGSLILTVLVGALFVYERPLGVLVGWSIRVSRALVGRPRGDAEAQVQRILQWVTTVRLGWREISSIVLWGVGNWLLDCACFAMMFLAVGSSIPWKGLLLAYGAGQLAATLPITPGGLGAVEGSITIALVAFGGSQVTTVDAVLMYRFISFWLILVVGWVLWGELALEVRKGRWSREALSTPTRAGIGGTPSPETSSSLSLETSSAAGS